KQKERSMQAEGRLRLAESIRRPQKPAPKNRLSLGGKPGETINATMLPDPAAGADMVRMRRFLVSHVPGLTCGEIATLIRSDSREPICRAAVSRHLLPPRATAS